MKSSNAKWTSDNLAATKCAGNTCAFRHVAQAITNCEQDAHSHTTHVKFDINMRSGVCSVCELRRCTHTRRAKIIIKSQLIFQVTSANQIHTRTRMLFNCKRICTSNIQRRHWCVYAIRTVIYIWLGGGGWAGTKTNLLQTNMNENNFTRLMYLVHNVAAAHISIQHWIPHAEQLKVFFFRFYK